MVIDNYTVTKVLLN